MYMLMKDQRNRGAPEENPPGQRILERRARKGGPAPEDGKGAGRRPLSAEAFQETVSRYCRRFQKDRREFCLSSISVLEYRKANDQEKEQLDKAVVSVLFKFLRAEDRICFIEPAHYLVLTPLTGLDEARIAMKRVSERVSSVKIRNKASFMHPSVMFKVASARLEGSDGDADAILDPETMYNRVGCTLDSKSRLRFIEDADEQHPEPLFRGTLEGWMERYASEKKMQPARRAKDEISRNSDWHKHLKDTWDGNAIVELRELSVPGLTAERSATTSGAAPGNLMRRLRILQNLDHPGLNRLIDFYVNRDGQLFLINRPPSGPELTALDWKDKQPLPIPITADVLISWLQQMLNAVIAMQAMVPPAVPSSFDKVRVFHTDNGGKDGGQIVLCDFDVEYLTAAGASLPADRASKSAPVCQQEFLEGIVQFVLRMSSTVEDSDGKKFAAFLEKLDANSKSTPTKLRAQIKNFQEEGHA